MQNILFFLNFSLMIALPLLLAWGLARWLRPGWKLFAIGAATFIFSQVGHLPFNGLIQNQLGWFTETEPVGQLIITAVFLGLSAGIFEETARYLVYRFWAKEARSWGKGLMLGAGHGGAEAIIIGLLGLLNFSIFYAVRSGALPAESVAPGQADVLQAQVNAFFSTPPGMIPLGALERLFALTAHMAMSLLVMQVFTRENIAWLFAAIGWHTLLNAVAVFASFTWNPYVTEALIGVIALASLGIIVWLRTPQPDMEAPEPLPPPEIGEREGKISADALQRSRYE